jgi:hypothetical protein
MPRPKGSKNKFIKPAPQRLKTQFANTAMANQLHADFCAGRGIYSYDGLRLKYEQLFTKDYFCLISFDTAWKRLLRKVQEVHGVDYETKYANAVRARTQPRNRKPKSGHTDDQNT